MLVALVTSNYSNAEVICSKQMNQALKKMGVNSTVEKIHLVSSEEYKAKSKRVYEEFRIMAHQIDSDQPSSEAQQIVVTSAFRNSIGVKYVPNGDYLKLKKLGYFDPLPELSNVKGHSIKEKIENFFSRLVTLAKNAYNSGNAVVTGKYKMPPEIQKAARSLMAFRQEYGIHAGDGFDLLTSGYVNINDFDEMIDNVKFNTIISGKDDSFRAYIDRGLIKAYELRQDKKHLIFVQFDKFCAVNQVVFKDYYPVVVKEYKDNYEGGFTSYDSYLESSTYKTYTPEYCANISQLNSIRNQLPSVEDPNEYHYRCKEQGADYNCRCPEGHAINPWYESCFLTRKTPSTTAMNKFEEFSRAHKSLPGAFFTRATFDKSIEDCRTVKILDSGASNSPLRWEKPTGNKSVK